LVIALQPLRADCDGVQLRRISLGFHGDLAVIRELVELAIVSDKSALARGHA
jgi:hypothetical protein